MLSFPTILTSQCQNSSISLTSFSILLQEGGKLNKRQLMEEALTESIRERQELERKLSKLSKTMDYFERAKREKERALLLEAFKQKQQDDEVYYNQQQEVGVKTYFLSQDVSVPLFCMSL
jgi:protein subunit release factor A